MVKTIVRLSSNLSARVAGIVLVLLFLLSIQVVLLTGAPKGGKPAVQAVAAIPTATALPSDEKKNGDGVAAVSHSENGDALIGERLFKTFNPKAGIACTSCHLANKDDRLIGPGLKTIGTRAGTRVAGLTADRYIRQSIVEPGAYVVEGYQNLMPKTFGKAFTESELDALVAYLLTLK